MKKHLRYLGVVLLVISLFAFASCKRITKISENHALKKEIKEEITKFEDACNRKDTQEIIDHFNPEMTKSIVKGLDLLDHLGVTRWFEALLPNLVNELAGSDLDLEELSVENVISIDIIPADIAINEFDSKKAKVDCDVIFSTEKTKINKRAIIDYIKMDEKWYIDKLKFDEVERE